MNSIDKNRRRLLGLISSTSFISACGISNFPTAENIFRSSKFLFEGTPDITLPRSEISKIPYASCYAKIGKNPRAFLVLSKAGDQTRDWISAESELIVTHNGLITKTVGLATDLSNTAWPYTNNLNYVDLLSGRAETIKLIDIRKLSLFNLSVRSKILSHTENVEIEIAELKFSTTHIIEQNHADKIGWSYTNEYWIDKNSGFIWKSIQHFAPDQPPIVLEILKPLGKA